MLVAAISVSAAAWAQTNSTPRIGAGEARDYIGKSVVVTGKVAEIHVTEKIVRLNIDKPFPNQPFTAVIFGDRTNSFKDLGSLKGARVEIAGKVAEFRNRPEIVLNRTNQVVVVEPAKK